MNNEKLTALEPYLREEAYPYELGTIRGFALSLINGDDSWLVEAYRSSSAGQGINSRANYMQAMDELQASPGLLECLENQIPFPTQILENNEPKIVVQKISFQEALERIGRFS